MKKTDCSSRRLRQGLLAVLLPLGVMSYLLIRHTDPGVEYLMQALLDRLPDSVNQAEAAAKWAVRLNALRLFSWLSGFLMGICGLTVFLVMKSYWRRDSKE